MTTSQYLERMVVALRDSQEHLKQTLQDIGGCDHAVNICCCDLRACIESNEELLKEVTQ